MAGSLFGALLEDMRAWCRGRIWVGRLILWLFLAYVVVRLVLDPLYWSLFNPLNLAIHEGGHLVFGYFGMFLGIAGGTLLQLAAPVGAMIVFLRQRDYFAISVCFVWLGVNLYSVGVYMADALRQQLPLVTVGQGHDNITHDWAYLFGRMGCLRSAEGIGWLTRRLGDVAMLTGLGGGLWLMWQMMGGGPRKGSNVSGTLEIG